MSQKRFRLRDISDENIQCEEISDNEEWITHGEIVDLLNDQHETIFQLRKELSDCNCTIRQLQDKIDVRNVLLEQFEDENEQLKKENKRLKNKLKFLNELNEPYGVLIEENMRLKAFIKRLTNNCGEIILMNGIRYKVDKILGDLE